MGNCLYATLIPLPSLPPHKKVMNGFLLIPESIPVITKVSTFDLLSLKYNVSFCLKCFIYSLALALILNALYGGRALIYSTVKVVNGPKMKIKSAIKT